MPNILGIAVVLLLVAIDLRATESTFGKVSLHRYESGALERRGGKLVLADTITVIDQTTKSEFRILHSELKEVITGTSRAGHSYVVLEIQHGYRPSIFLILGLRAEDFPRAVTALSTIQNLDARTETNLDIRLYKDDIQAFIDSARKVAKSFAGWTLVGATSDADRARPKSMEVILADSAMVMVGIDQAPVVGVEPSPFKRVEVVPYEAMERVDYELDRQPASFGAFAWKGYFFAAADAGEKQHWITIRYVRPSRQLDTMFLRLNGAEQRQFRTLLTQQSRKEFGMDYVANSSQQPGERPLDVMTIAESRACDLHKLTDEEQATLNEWLSTRRD